MNQAGKQDAFAAVASTVDELRARGARIWLENRQLKYQAPKGALSAEDLRGLAAIKPRLLEYLNCLEEGAFDARGEASRTPLTYSQQAHWKTYRLASQPHLRQIAAAILLRGPLDHAALRRALAETVRHHESLRTRFVMVDGIAFQIVDERRDVDIELERCATAEDPGEDEGIRRRIEAFIAQPVDVLVDPLQALKLIQISHHEHVLVQTMEHLISDGVSRGIFLRDLFSAYAQAIRGADIVLPRVGLQFREYARSLWFSNPEQQHRDYWQRTLGGCARVRFPADRLSSDNDVSGWGNVPLVLGRDFRPALLESCRRRKTTPVMSVFTAYVAAMMRWCAVDDAIVLFQTDGRTDHRTANTIGYFASVLYLHLSLGTQDTFVDLLKRVTNEFCRAHAHNDHGYLGVSVPQRPCGHNTAFNWQYQISERSPAMAASEEVDLIARPLAYSHPLIARMTRDAEPSIAFVDSGEEITAQLYFANARFSSGLMETFARNVTGFIQTLVSEPHRRVADVPVVR